MQPGSRRWRPVRSDFTDGVNTWASNTVYSPAWAAPSRPASSPDSRVATHRVATGPRPRPEELQPTFRAPPGPASDLHLRAGGPNRPARDSHQGGLLSSNPSFQFRPTAATAVTGRRRGSTQRAGKEGGESAPLREPLLPTQGAGRLDCGAHSRRPPAGEASHQQAEGGHRQHIQRLHVERNAADEVDLRHARIEPHEFITGEDHADQGAETDAQARSTAPGSSHRAETRAARAGGRAPGRRERPCPCPVPEPERPARTRC